MKRAIYALACGLLACANIVQAMQEGVKILPAESARDKAQALLQEFAQKYQRLVDEKYPKERSARGLALTGYGVAAKDLSDKYINKIRAVDPTALDNIESLNVQWRRKPTARERRQELLEYVQEYRQHLKEIEARAYEHPDDKVFAINNALNNLSQATGIKFDRNLANMDDALLKDLANSYAV